MMEPGDPFWTEISTPGPESIEVAGRALSRGSRVRLRPGGRGDVMDLALAGRIARVEGIDQDQEGAFHLAVVLDDDPGRDLGHGRFPGHRFFFTPEEVEPVDEPAVGGAPGPVPGKGRRLLVAGIGNVFLGDDGFGVEVARRLAERSLPADVEVQDFGIRGMDLVYALQGGYDGAILVDALPRGEVPGTLTTLEPELPASSNGTGPALLDTHGMDPVKVLAFARATGGRLPERLLVVGCEPAEVPGGHEYDDMAMGLSEPVAAAVDRAVERVAALAEAFHAGGGFFPDERR